MHAKRQTPPTKVTHLSNLPVVVVPCGKQLLETLWLSFLADLDDNNRVGGTFRWVLLDILLRVKQKEEFINDQFAVNGEKTMENRMNEAIE